MILFEVEARPSVRTQVKRRPLGLDIASCTAGSFYTIIRELPLRGWAVSTTPRPRQLSVCKFLNCKKPMRAY